MTSPRPLADEAPLAIVAVADLLSEAARAQDRFGTQADLPDYPAHARRLTRLAPTARGTVDKADADGRLSWADILTEEFHEALDEAGCTDGTVEALRAELVQVAAVALRWAVAIDTRTAAAQEVSP